MYKDTKWQLATVFVKYKMLIVMYNLQSSRLCGDMHTAVHIKCTIWDMAMHSDLGEYHCIQITFCIFVLEHCRICTDNSNALTDCSAAVDKALANCT